MPTFWRESELASDVHREVVAMAVGESFKDGREFPTTRALSPLVDSLNRYVPGLLAEFDPRWVSESMDAVYVLMGTKSGAYELEIFGVCELLSDFTYVPMYLRVSCSENGDRIIAFDLRVGENDRGAMSRLSQSTAAKRVHKLDRDPDMMSWSYTASYPELDTQVDADQ